MKRIINQIAGIFLIAIFVFTSCKEEDDIKSADVFTNKEFVYNLATKKFEPETELNGHINSAGGINLVYYYVLRDDHPPLLIYTDEPAAENRSDYNYTIPNASFASLDMDSVSGLKIMARHVDNTSSEGLVSISAYMPARPQLTEFPAVVSPDLSGGTSLISGKIEAESGLAKIDIYDNYNGAFALVESISNLNNAENYTLSYNYTYRKRASKLKVLVTDGIGVTEEVIIDLNVSYPVAIFSDVFMTAHTTGTNTIFIPETGTTAGNCSLNASEATMGFVYYATGSGPTFYSPANTSNIAKNFKCSGAEWVIQNPAALRATKFRVLIKGTAGVDNIYSRFDAGNIEELDDEFFTENGITAPTGSSARFDAAAAPTATVFNLTGGSIVYVRFPLPGNPSAYKNALIKVKEATSASGTSTIRFDIMVQK